MPVSGPKLGGARQGDSAGSGMGARSRGTPGYPVPPEMQSREVETEPANVDQDDIKNESVVDLAVEDVVTQLVAPLDITKASVSQGIVDQTTPLDLVVKGVVDGLVQAADAENHKGTFFALKIPDALAHRLAIPGGEPPEKLHVTLLYIKGLDPMKRAAVAQLAREWSAKTIPLDIKIGGVGRFSASEGSDGKDVVYLSVDSPGLGLMRSSLVSQLLDIGVDADQDHSWTPHITLKYVDPGEPAPIERIEPIHTQIFDTIIKEMRLVEMTPSGNPGEPSTEPTINAVIHQNATLLKKKHYLPHGVVGKGTNGVAFAIDGNRVLKVTADLDEAKAMNVVRQGKPKHVVHVFDVFQFPGIELYGIVQERLQPLTAKDRDEFEFMYEILGEISDRDHWERMSKKELWDRVREVIAAETEKVSNDRFENDARAAYDFFLKFQVEEMFADLKKLGIRWYDFHIGNVMRRGNDYVLIDLGASDSAGAEPPVLERAIHEATLRLLGEARADSVGVTIGRFQPFHRGHAALLRELAGKFSRIILIMGGLKKDERNPFSFKLRERMIKESVPDIISKVEIHEAKFEGKNSGFVPGILSQIIDKNDSTLKSDTAVQILVGQDRVQDMKGQLARAAAMRQRGDELSFDPTMAEVTTIPNVDEDGGGRVSGTALRRALENGDEQAVSKMVDPHLVSNPDEFHDIYFELRKELGVQDGGIEAAVESIIRESLAQVGGVRTIEDTLDGNVQRLANRRPYPIARDRLTELGSGKDGIAYDMGNNKVFKVTTDPDEAMASNALKGRGGENVVHIFDVFQFPPNKEPAPQDKVTTSRRKAKSKNVATAPVGTAGTEVAHSPIYGIVQEKLQPLSSQEQQELNSALGWIMDPDFKSTTRARFVAGDWPGTLREIENQMTRLLQAGEIEEAAGTTVDTRVGGRDPSVTANPIPTNAKPGQKLSPTEARAAAKRKVTQVKTVLEKYNLPGMSKELAQQGIKFADYHSGNIMKRGGSYVINDLGHADSRGGPPPMLEQMVDTVVNEIGSMGGPFGGPGNSVVGAKAGRSAVSSFTNPTDPDTEELWQNQLKDLNVQIGDTALPGQLKNLKK